MRLIAALTLVLFACKAESPQIPDANNDTLTGDVTGNDTTPADVTPPDTDDADDTTAPPDTGDTDDTTAPPDTGDTDDTTAPPDTGDTGDTTTVSELCTDKEGCTYCVHAVAPQTIEDCECPFCPTTPMTRELCEANQAAWDTVCGGESWHDTANCPVPRCMPMPELTCDEAGACVPSCDTSLCPRLACPPESQAVPEGECCPRCIDRCDTAEDCGLCLYSRVVESPTDCYCPLCPSHAVTQAQCAVNAASWQTHCAEWAQANPCPVPICLPTAAPICTDEGLCARNPNQCFWGDDCGTCRIATAPQSPADCACPTCPVPTSNTHCEAIEQAIAEHCYDFDYDSCLPVPCPRPPPIGCTSEYVCGYGDLLPEPEER